MHVPVAKKPRKKSVDNGIIIDTYDKGKLLILDVDTLNFVDNKEDFGVVVEKIDAELSSLFSD